MISNHELWLHEFDYLNNEVRNPNFGWKSTIQNDSTFRLVKSLFRTLGFKL